MLLKQCTYSQEVLEVGHRKLFYSATISSTIIIIIMCDIVCCHSILIFSDHFYIFPRAFTFKLSEIKYIYQANDEINCTVSLITGDFL